ncbi:MAG: hypothetical protein ABJJ53_19075 [Sulfitobacter sp.]
MLLPLAPATTQGAKVLVFGGSYIGLEAAARLPTDRLRRLWCDCASLGLRVFDAVANP